MHKKNLLELESIEYQIDNIIFLAYINSSNQFSYFMNQSEYKVKRFLKNLRDLTNSIVISYTRKKDNIYYS